MRKQNQASEFTLSREEVERLFAAAPSLRERCLLKLLYLCGLRRSEAISLELRDLDVERRRLTVVGKGGKARTVPMPAELAQELGWLAQSGRRRYVFESSRRPGYPIGPARVNAILMEASVRANVSSPNPRRRGINPHLLRHSFARHWLAGGGDLRALSHMLGHASVAITADVYGTPSQEFIEGEYDRVFGGAR